MGQAAKTGTPGSRFVLLMLLILVCLILLLFSIRQHAATQPNEGPAPNQNLEH